MQLSGGELDTTITIKEVYQQRRKGMDLGDLRNDLLQLIAIDPTKALEAAHKFYSTRLAAIGIADFEALLEQPWEDLEKLVEEFRHKLSVFFPAMQAMLREVQETLDEVMDNPEASGRTSGEQPESSPLSPGD